MTLPYATAQHSDICITEVQNANKFRPARAVACERASLYQREPISSASSIQRLAFEVSVAHVMNVCWRTGTTDPKALWQYPELLAESRL